MTAVIEPFDPDGATDDELRAYWRFDVAIERELEPDEPERPYDKFVHMLRNRPSWSHPKRWVVWSDDRSDIVATAYLGLDYLDHNRQNSWFYAAVHPDLRRAGLGRRLVEVVATTAAADGRTLLGVVTVEGTAGDRFIEALGADCRLTERKSELLLANVDWAMLEEWVARASERAIGYSLIGFDDRCPDDLLDAYNALEHVMNTAPRDDFEMEDFVQTPEQFREQERLGLEGGHHTWKLVARRDADGALAGFTELFFAPWHPDRCGQGGTGVRPEHRNLGLGRWLKAAMLLRLREEKPEVALVQTWNAFSNDAMLGINIAMGFALKTSYRDWQVPTARLARAEASA